MSTTTYARREGPPATVDVMGLDVAAVSEQETVTYVLEALARGRGGWLCTANLDILRQWRGSADVRELVSGADFVVADGMPLVWAGELQGYPLPERVAGSALILSLTAAAAETGASIFLLGGNPGTAEAAATELINLSPGLRVAGTLCPPLGFEHHPESLDRLAQTMSKTAADIVYVALGFPKQERLIVELRARMPETWFVPCGISFSLVAGEFQRAPAIARRLGLEWLYRLVQEPKRLYRRYVLQGIPFLFALLWSAFVVRLGSVAE